MSFLKKIAKNVGKVLSKTSDVGGSILKNVGKVTSIADKLTGGALSQAVFSTPIGMKGKAIYEAGKIASRSAKDVGSALQKGNVRDIAEAAKSAQKDFQKGRSVLMQQPNVRQGLDIGFGGLAG